MKLAIGDVVVYPTHGVGRVVAREKRVIVGADQEIVVLEFANGLTVILPLERAYQRVGCTNSIVTPRLRIRGAGRRGGRAA